MTRTRWTLRDLEAGSLDWRTLLRFTRHLPADSATFRAVNPERAEAAEWYAGHRTDMILADLVDAVQGLRAMLATKPGHRVKPPKPYPRPWDSDSREVRRIGSGAVLASQVREKYYQNAR